MQKQKRTAWLGSFILLLMLSMVSPGVAENLIWQIGKPDSSAKEFIPIQTQDFAQNPKLQSSPAFNIKEHTFIYTVTKTVDEKPDFPSALAANYSLRWQDAMPLRIIIRWQEDSPGNRRFEIHSAEFVKMYNQPDDIFLTLPSGRAGYLQLPRTTEWPYGKSSKEDIDYHVTFPVKKGWNEITIRYDSGGFRHHFYFDSLKLSSVDALEASGPVVTAATAKTGNLFVLPEKPLINLEVFNLAPREKYYLVYKLQDGFGETAEGGRITVTTNAEGYGSAAYQYNGNRKGFLELLVTVADGKGNPVALAMAKGRCRRPFGIVPTLPERDGKRSKFGVQNYDGTLQKGGSLANWEKYFQISRQMGVGYGRFFGFPWRMIEPNPGQYDWEYYDEIIKLAKKYQIEPMVLLLNAPRWAIPEGAPLSRHDGFANVPKMEPWANFVKTIVSRYKDTVRTWEIWNEPQYKGGYFWSTPEGGLPADYVNLLKNAYSAAKEVDPDALIVSSFGTLDFMEDTFKAGGGNYCDAVAMHYPAPDTRKTVVELMKRYQVQKPLWDSEALWHFSGDGTRSVAGDLIKGYVEDFEAGIARVFYFVAAGTAKDDDTEFWGLTDFDYTPRPSFYAFRTASDILDDAEYIGKMVFPEKTVGHLFRNKNKAVLVLWTQSEIPREVAISTGAAEVTIIDMMGNSHTEQTSGGRLKLSLNRNPLFLLGANLQLLSLNTLFRITPGSVVGIAGQKADFLVDIKNSPIDASLKLEPPTGFSIVPEKLSYRILKGQDFNLKFSLLIPADTGRKRTQVKALLQPDDVGLTGIETAAAVTTTDIKPGTNLLANPSFEEGARGWNVNPEGALTSSEEAHSGNGFVKLQPGTRLRIKDKLKVFPGEKYALTFWTKGNGLGKTILYTYDETGRPMSLNKDFYDFRTDSPTYQKTGTVFSAPENVYFIGIAFSLENGTAAIDDVELTMADIDQQFFPAKLNFSGKCTYAIIPPGLTGKMADWSKAEPLVLKNRSQVKGITDWQGEKDLSALAYPMWDENNFYLAVRVRDDRFVQNIASNGAYWSGDSIQFAIDPDNAGNKENYIEQGLFKSIDSGDVINREHIIATPLFIPQMYPGVVREARVKITALPDGIFYESAVPIASLWPLQLSPGKKFGFSLLVNDNDGEGRRGWIEWSSGIGGEKAPDQYGELTCVK